MPASGVPPPLTAPLRRRDRLRRLLPAGIVAGALTLLPSLILSAQQPEQHLEPGFQAEVEAARSPGQISETAIIHWQNANRIAGGHCTECLERIATLSFRIGHWQDAADAADRFDQLSTKPADKGYAELLRGSSLMRLHDDKPELLDLDNADQSFKAAFAHDPTLRSALYQDGRALAALHRDREARETFAHYAQIAPEGDRYRARALELAGDLALARVAMAPPFAVKTIDGRQLTLDALRGRVVLLDFWATWCVPCKELLPRLQQLSAALHDQPFTLVSISWDEDADAWQQFVAANHMTWPQVLDADHTLSRQYGVDALPHYFTIDGDGALQSEVVGVGPDDIEQRIRALLSKARTATPTHAATHP